MKKLSYLFSLIAISSFIACGGGQNADHDHEHDMEAHDESDHDHDHEAMEEAASSNDFVPAAEGAKVMFVNLENGAQVTSPVKVEMGVEGIQVHPAGEIIEGTGHHHIIIDEANVPTGEVVPADANHIHFGGGQTETEVELEPGKYTLTLQFADGLHRSYGEELSASVQIEVVAGE